MDRYQQRIEAAFLSCCSVGAAYDWLYEHRQSNKPTFFGKAPHALEFILARRLDPLIDLGIAQFGNSPNAIARVFKRGNVGTRAAALANPLVGPRSTVAQPGWLTVDGLKAIVTSGNNAELEAIAKNPFLSDSAIENLLQRKDEFSDISEENYLSMLVWLGSNPRMKQDYSGPMDGWAEYEHNRVFSAAWDLTRTMEPNVKNANVLYYLLRSVKHSRRFSNPLEVASRWKLKSKERDSSSFFDKTYNLRTIIANAHEANDILKNSDDFAFRSSFYRRFSIWKHPNWPSFIEEDGVSAFDELLRNEALWESQSRRDTLSELAWKLPDPSASMRAPNSFNAMVERYRIIYPEWFRDEDDEYSTATDAVTRRTESKIDKIMQVLDISNGAARQPISSHLLDTRTNINDSDRNNIENFIQKLDDLKRTIYNELESSNGSLQSSIDSLSSTIQSIIYWNRKNGERTHIPTWIWIVILSLIALVALK